MSGFIAHIQLRYTDLDPQGHVNNVRFADYLQEARAQFLLAGDAYSLLDSGCVVISQQIVYLAPIHLADDPLLAEVVVSALGAARFVLAYRLLQDGRLCAQATTTLSPFDFEQQRPRRLDDPERGYLAGFLTEVAPLRSLTTPRLAGRGTPLLVQCRWIDADRFGHINNVSMLDYVLAGRVHTTTRADPAMARLGTGHMDAHYWLVARQDIDHLRQMDLRPGGYLVLTAPVQLGNNSIVLATEIVDPDDGTVFARARVVLVCADSDGNKRPLPESSRGALEGLLVTGPAA